MVGEWKEQAEMMTRGAYGLRPFILTAAVASLKSGAALTRHSVSSIT